MLPEDVNNKLFPTKESVDELVSDINFAVTKFKEANLSVPFATFSSVITQHFLSMPYSWLKQVKAESAFSDYLNSEIKMYLAGLALEEKIKEFKKDGQNG